MMAKRKDERPLLQADEICLDPSFNLCPKFDETSIAAFPVAARGEMGVRVVDDCAEVHIM